jgi:hypothetical protein
VAPEAIAAVGLMAEDRRDVGLLAVTSADRLNAGWTAAQRARERGLAHARSHAERLFAHAPRHCGIVTVIDGHPATLAWLGGVGGHRVRSLGVEHFGQTGSIPDLYRHHGIDTNAIVAAAEGIAPGRPIRHLRALGFGGVDPTPRGARHSLQTERQWRAMLDDTLVGSKPRLRVLSSPAPVGLRTVCGGPARFCTATREEREMAESKGRASATRSFMKSRPKAKRQSSVVHSKARESKQASVLALLTQPSRTTLSAIME